MTSTLYASVACIQSKHENKVCGACGVGETLTLGSIPIFEPRLMASATPIIEIARVRLLQTCVVGGGGEEEKESRRHIYLLNETVGISND